MRKMRERPIQIYLRPDQDKALRQMAQAEKVSIAELVRRGVDQLLTTMPVEPDPLLGIIALGSSGKHDLAENHDKYLVESYRKEWESWQPNSLLTPARGSRSRKRTTTTTPKRRKRTRAPYKTSKRS